MDKSLFFRASFVTVAREKASLKVSNFWSWLFSLAFKKWNVDVFDVRDWLFFVIDPDIDDMPFLELCSFGFCED